MSIESPTIEEEFDKLTSQQMKDITREKFDLSSTRIVLENLEREGLIGPNDTLAEIKKVVEEEFKKIQDI